MPPPSRRWPPRPGPSCACASTRSWPVAAPCWRSAERLRRTHEPDLVAAATLLAGLRERARGQARRRRGSDGLRPGRARAGDQQARWPTTGPAGWPTRARERWSTSAAGSAPTWWRWPAPASTSPASTATRPESRWPGPTWPPWVCAGAWSRRTPPTLRRVGPRRGVRRPRPAGVVRADVRPGCLVATVDVGRAAARPGATGSRRQVGAGHPAPAGTSGVEAEWVSDGGDLVEAALWGPPLAQVRHRATVLPAGAHADRRRRPGPGAGRARPGVPVRARRRRHPGRSGHRGGCAGRRPAGRPSTWPTSPPTGWSPRRSRGRTALSRSCPTGRGRCAPPCAAATWAR